MHYRYILLLIAHILLVGMPIYPAASTDKKPLAKTKKEARRLFKLLSTIEQLKRQARVLSSGMNMPTPIVDTKGNTFLHRAVEIRDHTLTQQLCTHIESHPA